MRPFIKQITDSLLQENGTFAAYSFKRSIVVDELLSAAGAYCAFCESPWSEAGSIFKLSTSTSDLSYPVSEGVYCTTVVGLRDFERYWHNHLLVCSSCHAQRGDYPGMRQGLDILRERSREEFDAIINSLTDGTPLNDKQALVVFSAAMSCMVWPDTSLNQGGELIEAGDLTRDLFTYELSEKSPVDLAQAHLRAPLSDIELQSPWAIHAVKRLWVIPNEAYLRSLDPITSAAMRFRVQNTLLALNLNHAPPDDAGNADQRVFKRTETYVVARNLWDGILTELVTPLINQMGEDDLDEEEITESPIFQVHLRAYSAFVQRNGFWSAIAFALGESLASGIWSEFAVETKENLFYDTMIQYEPLLKEGKPNDAPEGVMVISGSDVERIALHWRTENV